jgi:hypothetical protein
MAYLLIQENVPPVRIEGSREAFDAAMALDSIKASSVLVGLRHDGTRAPILHTGRLSHEDALRLAGAS